MARGEPAVPREDIRQRVFQAIRNAIADTIRVSVEFFNPRPGTAITSFAVDGVGSNDLNVDGSSTPLVFTITPNSEKKFIVKSFVVTMIDTGIKFNKFAGLPALTNGLKIEIKEGGNPSAETVESPFKVNSQFYEAGFITLIQTEEKDILVAKLNLFEQFGTTVELANSRSDVITVTIQDNLTSIDSFRILAQGYEVDE